MAPFSGSPLKFGASISASNWHTFLHQPTADHAQTLVHYHALSLVACAAGQGHAETARFLVSKGANKSLKEKLELTALEIAKKTGHAQIAAMLQ